MEEDDLALTHHLARDQRCAIAERGNHPVRQRGVGLCHDLCSDHNVIGDREAEEGRGFLEGFQLFRFSPAHRTADAAATSAQAHWHQRVFVLAADVAGSDPGASETHQHAALVNPFDQRLGFGLCQAGHIRQDDHIGVGGQHVSDGTVDQIGCGGKGLFDVVQRREQLQAFAVTVAADERHFAAPQAIVHQRRGPGRTLAADGETGDARAQLGGERKLGRCCGIAGAKGGVCCGQDARVACRVTAFGADHNLAFQSCGGAGDLQIDDVVVIERRGDGQHVGGGLVDLNTALRLHGVEHGVAAFEIQSIAEPDGVKGTQARHDLSRAGDVGLRGLPRRRGEARKTGAPDISGLESRFIWPRQRQETHGTCGAAGAGQLCLNRLGLLRPACGTGPGAIQHNEQRPIAFGAVHFGVQYGACKAKDDGGDRQHAQQEEPPWRAVGNGFVVLEAKEKGHAGKPAPDWRRGYGAQDQPQDRQRQKRQQQPGGRKADATQNRHAATPARASNAP